MSWHLLHTVSVCIFAWISPWKKCSLEACWSSFPVEIVWPFCCWGTFLTSVSLFSGADKVVPVCPDCWLNKPEGLRGVTVSSRILLSWKMYRNKTKKQHIRHTQAGSGVFHFQCTKEKDRLQYLDHYSLCEANIESEWKVGDNYTHSRTIDGFCGFLGPPLYIHIQK